MAKSRSSSARAERIASRMRARATSGRRRMSQFGKRLGTKQRGHAGVSTRAAVRLRGFAPLARAPLLPSGEGAGDEGAGIAVSPAYVVRSALARKTPVSAYQPG